MILGRKSEKSSIQNDNSSQSITPNNAISKRDDSSLGAETTKTSEEIPHYEVSESEENKLIHAFEETPSLFRLLSSVRTRRVGLGYQVESGEEEIFDWSSGNTTIQSKGPLAYVSRSEPVPLSELEEALLCWAALGPNGVILSDVAVNGGLSGMLSWAGRTVPSSSNDLSVDLFIINDSGVHVYKPSTDRVAPIEIKGRDDYGKILKWYREGLQKVSDKRPDLSWPSSPEGTKIVNATGPGQYNLNRPGSTWLLPVGDVGLEWFNQLLTSYEWSGFYLMDPESGDPAGCGDWIRPGFLEVGFPIPAFDELALMLHAGQCGAIVQNIRLASEALGLGAWTTGSYADDLVLGAYPEVAKGLGFNFLPRETTRNPSATATCLGLPGVKEATAVPSHRFKDGESAVKYVTELRTKKGAQLSRDDNWTISAGGPFKEGVMQDIMTDPRTYIADWAVEAAIATVDYIVDKYGCAPAFISPIRAKLSVQLHHVDPNFYRKYQSGDGEPFALTDQIKGHFPRWHSGEVDPMFSAQNNDDHN